MSKDKTLFELKWGKNVASHGWTQVPNALLEAQGLLGIRSPEMITIIACLSYAWDEKFPYPSVGTIAKKAGLKRATVQRHFKMLERRDLIVRIKRVNDTNVYDMRPLAIKLDKVTKEYLDSKAYKRLNRGDSKKAYTGTVKEFITNKTQGNNTQFKNTFKPHAEIERGVK